MGCRKNARIIHAYLVWFVIEAAAAGRVFDEMSPPIRDVITEAGRDISIACPGVTERSLVIMLEWRFNNVPILEHSNSGTNMLSHRNRLTFFANNFTLYFRPVKSVDSGDYECLVNNRKTPEAIVRLIVQDVPDPPERPLIMSFTSRSVSLSWAPSANSHNNPISHYIIETRMGDSELEDWDDSREIKTSTNDTTYTIEDLLPYTVYSFRVSAVNARGRSEPSRPSYYIITLREVPNGKPTIIAAHNTSVSSIFIAWKPPKRNTIHGEFLGYRIAYRPRDKGPNEVKEIYIRDSKVESHTIQDLETYTQYFVSLQVFNPEGHGPSTQVIVTTDEGVPTKPLNLTTRVITSNSIDLAWLRPEKANGVIGGYRIYYIHENFTSVETHKVSENLQQNRTIEFTLNNLKPNTEYKIWVKAYTWKNEGEPSEFITTKTDSIGPEAPLILNLTCQADDAIFLQWARPSSAANIDYYYVNYKEENADDYKEIELPSEKEHLEYAMTIPNLTLNTVYEVTIRGATRSLIYRDLKIQGTSTDTKKVLVARDCDKIAPLMPRSNKEFSAGVIAGIVCACFAVMFAITSFVLWRPCFRPIFRKCFHTAYYFLDYPPRNVPTLQEWENSEQDGERTAVSVDNFVQHVAALHADGDIGFSKEYEIIQAETGDYTVENSQFAENKTKNRYLNILAYDHTRVQLLSCGGGPPKKGQDYVNANYIDGWQRARAFIGTQGPLPPTFDGFWRMIWEQRVSIIVMITNLVERGRRKCDMYWPKEGTETYGHVQVSLAKEDVLATYTIRTLHIRHLKVKKKKNGSSLAERTVLQYHYTGWPDHGVPDHPLHVLSFVRKSSNANPPDAGPIIVHCSAGVGRTGTYIVIDAMLKQAKSKGEINVFGFLRHIRTQRNFLVQTEEQYIFIHDALQEAIESGETNIESVQLLQYVQDMLCASNNKINPWNNLEAQYKLVTSWKPKDFNLVSATKPCNVPKNRNMEIVPIENSRVHLVPKPGIDGSDYINATWVSGFHQNREFIITQHPLKETIMEFWQMLWNHNAQTVVMLTQCDEEYPEFWPAEGEDLESENFRVRMCGVKEMANGVILRDLAVRSLQDDYELSARIVHRPHNNNPKSFIKIIQDFQREYQNGPIVTMDRFGGIEAGLFVLLTTLMKQLEFEQSADIYMYAKLLYMKRPGIFRSKDDYELLYQCLETMLTSKSKGEPDLYISANGHAGTYTAPSSATPTQEPEECAQNFASKMTEFVCEDETNVDFVQGYTVPMLNDQCAMSMGAEACSENRSSAVYTSHPTATVSIDMNGCIMNGNMRVPPEGMEATCTIVPQ